MRQLTVGVFCSTFYKRYRPPIRIESVEYYRSAQIVIDIDNQCVQYADNWLCPVS